MSIAQTELARPSSPPAFSPTGPISEPVVIPGAHPALRPPTRAEWTAAGLSLLLHLVAILVLLALLVPITTVPKGKSIDGEFGAEDGTGDLFDAVAIGSPDPGKGQDLEKTAVSTVDGVPAIEGALSASSGSGTGRGHVDAIAALGSGGGGSGKGIGFFGTRSRADSVVFIVDMSDSMNDDRRFKRAVDELVRSLNAMEPSQKFFIFFYNNRTFPMMDRSDKLVAATVGMRTKAIKWAKSLIPTGGTQPQEALERSLKMKPQVIYFLTDGEIPDVSRDAANNWNEGHKTVIHTIAFVTKEGEAILKSIAADNRGKYRFVP